MIRGVTINIPGFEKIVGVLLVLVGSVLMQSSLLTEVSQEDNGMIIKLLLRYGFQIGMILIVLGVLALTARCKHREYKYMIEPIEWPMERSDYIRFQTRPLEATDLAEKLLASPQGQLSAKYEQIRALAEAITTLPKTGASTESIDDALQALEQGDMSKAQAIFAEVLRSKEAEVWQAKKEAATAARHLGAWAFMDDTKAALAAYQKAVEFNPDNADGWNQLGNLLHRTWDLEKAEEAYRKVLALGEAHQDKREQAKGLGNLGNVYQTRGELDKAEEMHRKSLTISEALGLKKGTANQYGNLGNVAYTRGELDKAEELWKQSLSLYQEMRDIEHPCAKIVQRNLDKLAQHRASQPAPPAASPRR